MNLVVFGALQDFRVRRKFNQQIYYNFPFKN